MNYEKFEGMTFFKEFRSEKQALRFAWRTKFEGRNFVCPHCLHKKYWEFVCDPEIRKCRACNRQVRLRVGTAFENSKIPMLTWLRAIYFVMSSKRGISALELQRRLEIGQYRTSLNVLNRVRQALLERDSKYVLRDSIQLEGSCFFGGPNDEKNVSVAIETREWIDERGRKKSKAGFAKVLIGNRNDLSAVEDFVEQNILPGAKIFSNGGAVNSSQIESVPVIRNVTSFKDSDDVQWAQRFISNAKVWIAGTHHGIDKRFLHLYLAEFTYRFNRRHDPDALFHRALYAMMMSKKVSKIDAA